MHETLCPSGLRGWTQVPLARAAWVQIPQVSYLIVWLCVSGVSSSKSPQPHRCVGYALANRSPARWPRLVFNCMDGWRELRTGRTAWACKDQKDCTKWQEDVNLFISTSGVAQWLACWAHNPKVRGSKPRSAILLTPWQQMWTCNNPLRLPLSGCTPQTYSGHALSAWQILCMHLKNGGLRDG